jgi:glycine cleavage system H protein
MVVFPKELRFMPSHEWAKLDGDVVTVGISAHAVKQLSDLVYIELPEKGKKVKKGEAFGEIESVKAVSELFSPVDGEIVDVNAALSDNLESITKEPYGSGWMIKVKASDPNQVASLLSAEEYEKQVKEKKDNH